MDKLYYKETLIKTRLDLDAKLYERDRLDAEIAKLRQIVSGLASVLGEEETVYDGASPHNSVRLSEACLDVLRVANRELMPKEVRQELLATGYELSARHGLSSIHTTLKRLAEAGKVTPGKNKASKTVYRIRFSPPHGYKPVLTEPPPQSSSDKKK